MLTIRIPFRTLCATLLASSSLALLTGCGAGTGANKSGSATTPVAATGTISGHVHGGQQPVTGASIYLYAVSTTGYGNGSTSLLSGANVLSDASGNGYVVTDGGGGFSITGDYACPSATSLVYLLAAGGNPGLGSGSNNPSLLLAAALGNCALLKANAATTNININELTTVALGYALAAFITSPTHIGSSSTNLVGIVNAFNTADTLVNTSSGTAPTATPTGNGVIPQAEINTLGDILAACVNSNGVIAGPSNPTACYSLFSATAAGGTMPADTLQAVINIAHHPANNINALAQLVSTVVPFAPTLASTPMDWTMAITFTGGGINTPQAVAIDVAGNAWIANASNTITQLSGGTGSALSGANGTAATGLDAPVSLAIDTLGQAWVANCGGVCSSSGNPSTVTLLGANQQSANYSSGALSGAYAIAIGATSQVWVANSLSSSVTQLNAAGVTTIAASTSSNLVSPTSVAADAAGNVLVVSPADNALVGFTSAGAAYSSETYQGSALNYPYAVAIDHAGHAWVANHGNNTVTELSGGAPVGASPFSGGGITTPVAIAIDGAGNAWVANTSGSLSELSNAGVAISPANGFRNDLVYPDSLGIDGSGNVWVANCGAYCVPTSVGTGSVILLIGAATPVVTPLALGAMNQSLGSAP